MVDVRPNNEVFYRKKRNIFVIMSDMFPVKPHGLFHISIFELCIREAFVKLLIIFTKFKKRLTYMGTRVLNMTSE